MQNKISEPNISANGIYVILFQLSARCFFESIDCSTVIQTDDWALIFEESKKQGIGALIYSLLTPQEKSSIPPDIQLKWRQITIDTWIRNENIRKVQDKIVGAFSANNVKYVIAKGLSAASHYSIQVRSYRYQADIDMIIDKQDYQLVLRIMNELGMTQTYNDAVRMKCYSEGVHIEIETNRFGISYELLQKCGGRIEIIPDRQKPFFAMPDQLQLQFALRHMRNHILESSIGMRHVLDFVAMYIESKENGQIEEITELMSPKDRVLFNTFAEVSECCIICDDCSMNNDLQNFLYDVLNGGDFGCKSSNRSAANAFIRKYRFPQCIIRLLSAISIYAGKPHNTSKRKSMKALQMMKTAINTYKKSSKKERKELFDELRKVKSRAKLYRMYGIV